MTLAGMGCLCASSIAAPADCEEGYFSPEDFNHARPLLKPYPEFAESYKRAKAGDAVEQRNMAVSYDAGYLVNACPEKAHFWYQKAAANGDRIAQNWLARYNKLKAISDGPEFALMHKDSPLQENAPEPTPATAKVGGTGRSAEDMLPELSQPPKPTSTEAKLIGIGQLLGDLMSAQATSAPTPAK